MKTLSQRMAIAFLFCRTKPLPHPWLGIKRRNREKRQPSMKAARCNARAAFFARNCIVSDIGTRSRLI